MGPTGTQRRPLLSVHGNRKARSIQSGDAVTKTGTQYGDVVCTVPTVSGRYSTDNSYKIAQSGNAVTQTDVQYGGVGCTVPTVSVGYPTDNSFGNSDPFK